jgi:hypothetical protein
MMDDDECGEVGGMSGREKTCSSDALSTTNPILPDLVSNLCRCGGKPVTKFLSYVTAIFQLKYYIYLMSFLNVAKAK